MNASARVLAATLLAASLVPFTTATADAAECAPATRTLTTKTQADPLLLGPRGHVLTSESEPGTAPDLWLHNPDGSTERVAQVNSPSPDGPRDINANGYVIGTDRHLGFNNPYTPWVYGLGDYWTIPLPADATDDYLAVALNRTGATVGVHTNARTATPTQTGYFSRPQVWPTLGKFPVTLSLPHAGYYVVGGVARPLIDLRADGRISAIVDDHSGTRYLARWSDAQAQPSLVELPNGLDPRDVAGRWVIGLSGLTPSYGNAVVWTPNGASQLVAPLGNFIDLGVTANGTYAATVSVEQSGATRRNSLIGRGAAAPRTVADAGLQVAVEPTRHGQLLLDGFNQVAVTSCALNLAEASDITVSAWP